MDQYLLIISIVNITTVSMSSKRKSTRKQMEVEEPVQQIEDESSGSDNEKPEVTNWVQETNAQNNAQNNPQNNPPHEPSVVDFDRKEVEAYEPKLVSDCGVEELLKVLIVRGENSLNPVLAGGCKKTLKQIKGERYSNRPQNTRRSTNFRGKPRRGRGYNGPHPRSNNRRNSEEDTMPQKEVRNRTT